MELEKMIEIIEKKEPCTWVDLRSMGLGFEEMIDEVYYFSRKGCTYEFKPVADDMYMYFFIKAYDTPEEL